MRNAPTTNRHVLWIALTRVTWRPVISIIMSHEREHDQRAPLDLIHALLGNLQKPLINLSSEIGRSQEKKSTQTENAKNVSESLKTRSTSYRKVSSRWICSRGQVFFYRFWRFRRKFLFNVYNEEEVMPGDVNLVRKKETNYVLTHNSLPQRKESTW